MRPLLLAAVCVLVASLACADGGPGSVGGGVVVTPDPGFCWGGGVVPQPPPDFCWSDGIVINPPVDYWPVDVTPGPGVTPVYNPEAVFDYTSLSDTGGAASPSSPPQQTTAPARERRSQMYIPPAVWQWVAEHPARVR